MFIDNYIKTLINTIKNKIYTVGTEPIEGGWDTIENQNKLLYRDAYKITGLKGDTYQKFVTQHLH